MVVGGVSTGHLLRDIADVQGQLVFKSLALHHDQYRDNEAGYDNCYDEDSDDNFDDGDDWLDLHDDGEEARQPHRDRVVAVCCPSFKVAVIIMMIILNMTLMALLQKDVRITCWPSSIAFDADDNDVIQTWKENCIQ